MHLFTDCLKVRARHSPLVTTLPLLKPHLVKTLYLSFCFQSENSDQTHIILHLPGKIGQGFVWSIWISVHFCEKLLQCHGQWRCCYGEKGMIMTLRSCNHSVSLDGSSILNGSQWLLVFHSMKLCISASTVFVFVFLLYLYFYCRVSRLLPHVWKSPL